MNSIIENLLDGDIYTPEEIACLADTDIAHVLEVKNRHLHSDEFVGDGSGVIYYMDIKYDTIVDGVGFRNTVYCAKCNMYCKGCHNPSSWNINACPSNTITYSLLMLGLPTRSFFHFENSMIKARVSFSLVLKGL